MLCRRCGTYTKTPTRAVDPQTKSTTYSFPVSAKWLQPLSANDVPIQGDTGTPRPIVNLTKPGGAVNLQWGRSSPSPSWDRSS